MTRLTLIICTFLLVTACTSKTSGDNSLETSKGVVANTQLEEKAPIRLNEEDRVTLVEKLAIPWSIDKHEETFYVTERTGRLLEINERGEINEQELILSHEVLPYGEGGLLGFVLAPDFEESKQAYVYHTYQHDNQILNRVVLLEKNYNQWEEVNVIIEGIPGAQYHNGGRLEIGSDNKLYVTTGDAINRMQAQNLDSLAGKILRVNLDGSIPEDNPFRGSFIYSYGHRNPQGMTWDENGTMYSSEHGNSAHDEINIIKSGGNYGWPLIEGDQERQGMISPIYHTGNNTWAPSGMDYYNGKLYIAGLRGSKIISYDIETGKAVTSYEDSGRMRDIYIKNGYLYTITSNRDGRGNPDENDDQLLRLKLKGES
ncbi:PQQ-dependent sugar dehydrogenase [Filobacillus milosensis]|uniref:PQQ-dependent sugar dehydrogenase n=1 Tax=Filobacillus milosensis TaxID=94137 RepID=A0A4Y8IGN5_9BACI|nr:PQQ-dependent sugar dehydrogenase [Filobacillus milosensis]TFB14607.1 PQQ-dependent sugar dehydrogenase [Filobacillus milosensis]